MDPRELAALSKYLQAYTRIFKQNPRARYYSISYVDAFAGTGTLHRPELGGLAEFIPGIRESDEEFRKGSVRRALEVYPAFDEYVFIEKSANKCRELRTVAQNYPSKKIRIVQENANKALLQWCENLDTQRSRAVVFLDPFGASVKWEAISALGRTGAVDLWVLFPYSAINRMLIRDRKPPRKWAECLDGVFGTHEWENAFYETASFPSLFDSAEQIEIVRKTVDFRNITAFIIRRLETEFKAVTSPLPLYNSTGSLLFLLLFAAGNTRSAITGLKIANSIIGK